MTKNKKYRILVINPGSTSTKIGIFQNNTCQYKETIEHKKEELAKFKEIKDQKEFRLKMVLDTLAKTNIDISTIDAFSGRGGGLVSCPGGSYIINQKMYEHASTMYTVKHPAALGATLCYELGQMYGKPSFCVNPPDVDEFITEARITGIKDLYRESRVHALNQKEVAQVYAKSIGKKYKDLNLIVCHLGGGISITAHNHGKMIDSNDNVNGDGPMTPNRSGFVPAKPLIKKCFEKKLTEQELNAKINKMGGLLSWLGTDDVKEIKARIAKKDIKAKTIYDAMIYQIAKQIGSMYVALKCNCSAIILTGGIARDDYLVKRIKKYVDKLAVVVAMPGEFELEALASGALRVLNKEETPMNYTGEPVFKGL